MCEWCGKDEDYPEKDGLHLCPSCERTREMEAVWDSYYENRVNDEPINMKMYFESFGFTWLEEPKSLTDVFTGKLQL